MTLDTMEIVDENKTPDKNEIEAEEKEQMLKDKPLEENQESIDNKQSEEILKPSEVKTEREAKPKFIPIGGIKMPGFIMRAIEREPKEQLKDEEAGEDVEQTNENNRRKRRMLFTCPFTTFLHKHEENDKSTTAEATNEPSSTTRRYNFQSISAPLTNLFHRNVRKEATLASVETLEDKVDAANDGMETIKLDDKEEKEPEIEQPRLPWRERLRLKQFILDDLIIAVVLFVMVVAVLIGVIVTLALAGPPMERPLRDHKYMSASTTCGEVEGVLTEGAFKFYGIPYAVPPVGERRFNYTQPFNSLEYCWNETRRAHEPVPPCIQILENGTVIGKEDCLTLDIVTPKVRYDNPVAVVVFIDVNTLAGGIGPSHLSSKYSHLKDVVFVKPNFRLGALGFLALEILSNERHTKTSGNYAISDLLVALEWVQHNIHHFGGDPKKVTIYGHRAGATLASVITSMRRARKLYRAAWLVSGSVSFNGSSLQDVENANKVFLTMTGCNDTECLRNLPAETIVKSTPDLWLSRHGMELPKIGEIQRSWIVIDGDLVRVDPLKGWEEERKRADVRSKPLVFVTTEHAAHSETVFKRHLHWNEKEVEAEFNASALAPAHELLYQFGRNYSGLAALTTSVRLTCPLHYAARIRLDLPMIVIRGVEGLSDVNADLGAILGTVDTPGPINRRHVAAVQAMFYNLVWDGKLTTPSQIVIIEQDPLPTPSLTGCNVMFQKDLVPRYALVD